MSDRRLTFTPRPERQPDAETLAWIATIEAIRQAEAPACCPTCGCTAKHIPETRRCIGPCGRTLPLDAFHPAPARPLGRRYECKDCQNVRMRAWRRDRKRRQFRALLSEVAS